MKLLTIHLNTRDDRGRKCPADRRTVVAVARMLQAAYERELARMKGDAMAAKIKRVKPKRLSKTAKAKKIDRTVVYPSKKGWSWRSKTKNGKKVSIGGESYVRYRRCVGAALKWGPYGFPLFVQKAGKLIPIDTKFAKAAAFEMA